MLNFTCKRERERVCIITKIKIDDEVWLCVGWKKHEFYSNFIVTLIVKERESALHKFYDLLNLTCKRERERVHNIKK